MSITADSEAPEPEEAPTTEKEVSWHIRDRWLFDADNELSVGPNVPGEKDRVLDSSWMNSIQGMCFFVTKIFHR